MSHTPPTSSMLWFVNSPAAQSSSSRYPVTQTWCRANLALRDTWLRSSASSSCEADGVSLNPTLRPDTALRFVVFSNLTTRFSRGSASIQRALSTTDLRTS
ncbi:hypothetical protein CH063_15383 [Colletotrichum higginsianum]|uniref:Uncharacterized protein n=1 Tax=Colletotrichum higginsianum (strain IMI 349063) TaxID=759273 RepID=H1W2J9_COLHI|nr:hypothetical protein CH063_15383 [Colletotrichum higginsianum]